MPSKAVLQLLEQGERSGLFSAAAAASAIAQTSTEEALSTEQVASQLIEKKVLTPYQAEQLLAGRAEECLVAGRYRILEKLGEGGMGTVYKAHDTQLDRYVAVKVLPAQRLNDADAIARFQREARALAKLSHPHIVQAYDNGVDKGRHFLVMEYVEGASLAAILREQGAIPPTLAADMIYQAALGLEHAHQKGLVHRDVKPANLLLSGAQPLAGSRPSARKEPALEITTSYVAPAPLSKGIVKILDLGLARFLLDQLGDSQLTREGIGVGTPDYMAPEQFRDALHVDARTDIYGLGCTLYQLISGTVPFPGSSFSEKAQAHAKREPIPLEERCPEVPAGLALVVSKMMAKHPADRFQSAADAAEALAPYIAGASHSAILLKQTMRFHAGQLTVRDPKGRKRPLAWAGGLIAAACFVVLLILAWPSLFPARWGNVQSDSQAHNRPPVAPTSEPAKPQVVTIENGLTVAKDGTGQFTTISEALENVKSGMTIRVLDDAVYNEILLISRRAHHTGITLEAPRQATLLLPNCKVGLQIVNVPRVTVRGFKVRHDGEVGYLIGAAGMCQGFRLQRLDVRVNNKVSGAVTLEGIPPGGELSVVEQCTIQGGGNALRVSGYGDYTIANPCGTIVLRDNTILDSQKGISLLGSVKQIHVVGNRVAFSDLTGFQLENLLDGTEDILVANNTVLDCAFGMRLWDNVKKTDLGQRVRFVNNLVLGSTNPDLVFVDSGGDQQRMKGPGNGRYLHEAWTWEKNWRETREPTGDDDFSKSWIPIAAADKRQDKIEVVSRDPLQADFLRPAKDSPLATGGAGGDLPGYVGAVPAAGAPAWDWQWTWDAQVNKRITVSQQPEDGGRFRTINEALEAAGPRMTVHVLDDAVYEEPLALNRASQHEGLTLESVRRATIAPLTGNVALGIFNVPRVTVRGFRLRAASELIFLVGVVGKSLGVRMDDLELDKKTTVAQYRGITLEQIDLGSHDDPVVIQNCSIHRAAVGIRISGLGVDYKSSTPTARVIVRNNRVTDPEDGIALLGTVKDALVAGNCINGASKAAIQFENMLPGADNILIANNTVVESTFAFKLRDNMSKAGFGTNVRLQNNLVLDAKGIDMLFVDSGGDANQDSGPGDGKSLLAKWTLSHNWREIKTPADKFGREWIPPAADDAPITDRIDVISRDARNADFARPAKDSLLATSGAGSDLPSYVGAIPPEEVEPWDWDKTWQAQARKND